MNSSDLPDETLFENALKCRTPEERATYLEQACAGQPELLRRLEVLLAAHERSGEFLEPAVPADRSTLKLDVLPKEVPGTVIGRYKLLQQIGEGGCGVVYMAEQAEPVRRRVALKIIKLGMDTKSVIARFEAERQALAMMDHPNIAKVFDAGATETGRPYFVMELVRGMKITDYCDEKKLPTRARLDLFIQVCQAIQHAHQKGIIHRDIKPSNVLVTVNDGVAVPKVIDFGIAKATSGQQLTDKTLFTAFEQFIGTPAYMSPEQAVLTSLDIDTRSDIYALGVLLYEMLTGRTPFDAQELLAIGLDEMRRTIREQEPPRPSARLSTLPGQELSTTAQRRGLDAPKLVSELRGDLDWIVMKALEKDRARRYETANGLAADVQRHLNHEPVAARPPSNLYRFQKLVRRNKFVFTAGTSVVAALLIGLGVATWMFVKERAAVREQSRLRQQAQTEAVKSRQVAQFLQDMLNGVGPSVALGRDTEMLREILDKTAERVGRDLKGQPDVEAELRSTIGRVYFALGAYQKSAEMHRAALATRQRLFGDEHLDVAGSLNNLGVVLDYQEKYSEAEPMLRKASYMRRKLLSNDHPDLATSLHDVAHVLADQAKFAEAVPMHLEALAMRKRLFGNEHLDVARSLTQLAYVLRKQGKFVEAEPLFREALAMRRKLVGNEHLEVEHSLFHLAALLRDVRRFAEAETVYREAFAIKRRQTPEHPGLGSLLTGLGRALEGQGRIEEAETMYREAVQRQRKLLPNEHYETRVPVSFLADVLLRQGKLAEVQSFLGELAERGEAWTLNGLAWQMATSDDPKVRDGSMAVSFAEKAVAAATRKEPHFLNTLAAAYAEAGQFEKAVSVQQEAIALLQDEELRGEFTFRLRLFESNSPYRDGAYDAGSLADSVLRLLEQGKFAEAESPARDCLAIREKNMPDHWRTFNARSMLGGSLLGQKKYAEAEPLLLSSYEGLKQRETQIPAAGKPRIREALQRLVQLYEATGRMAQATEWKQKLGEFDQTMAPKAQPQAK